MRTANGDLWWVPAIDDDLRILDLRITSIDINNIDNVGKGMLAMAKYEYWASTVSLFTRNAFPNRMQTSNQDLSRAEAMFYVATDDKKSDGLPDDL
jgi:hypothetical protein